MCTMSKQQILKGGSGIVIDITIWVALSQLQLSLQLITEVLLFVGIITKYKLALRAIYFFTDSLLNWASITNVQC